MSYTNPNDWSPPKTESGEPPSIPTHGNDGEGTGVDSTWKAADGIANTDLDRIETNIKGLHTLLCQSGVVHVEVDIPYFTARATSWWNWTRINNIVFLGMREMTSADQTNNDELQINPVTVWPDEILPENDTLVKCIFQKNQQDTVSMRPGFFIMPSLNNSPIVCYITNYDVGADMDGCFCSGAELGYVGFSDGNIGGGLKKAIPSQTVCYMTDRDAIDSTSTTTSTTTPAP